MGGFKAVEELEYFKPELLGKILLLGIPLSLSCLFSQVIIWALLSRLLRLSSSFFRSESQVACSCACSSSRRSPSRRSSAATRVCSSTCSCFCCTKDSCCKITVLFILSFYVRVFLSFLMLSIIFCAFSSSVLLKFSLSSIFAVFAFSSKRFYSKMSIYAFVAIIWFYELTLVVSTRELSFLMISSLSSSSLCRPECFRLNSVIDRSCANLFWSRILFWSRSSRSSARTLANSDS